MVHVLYINTFKPVCHIVSIAMCMTKRWKPFVQIVQPHCVLNAKSMTMFYADVMGSVIRAVVM